jgi:hypothetical protein
VSSPKIEVFFLYNAVTGVPLVGQVGLTFVSYKDDLGTNLTPPVIAEVGGPGLGGGAYWFAPIFTDLARGIVYVVDTPNGSVPTYFSRFMRPEDWNDPAGTPRFLMRAWHYIGAGSPSFVYWTVMGAPDLAAAQAPVPAAELTDILVAYSYPV